MMQLLIQSFVTGFGILAVALLLNVVAGLLHISTWYDLVKQPAHTSVASYVWLFIVYPFLLGLTAYIILQLVS